MAISLKTAGTWARMVTDGGTVAIPGTPAAGDRMFLFGTWKTYTVTVANPTNWTPIGTVFADGTDAAGNGTGSVAVMAWYRDWQSGDAAPAIDYSAAPTEGLWVIQLWTKAGGDTWGAPQTVTAAIAAADPFSATASATLDVPDASVVMCLIGLRDDSSTLARSATTAIEDDGSPDVTWNGNYVESPATHISSTTGFDMAADLGHRFVTTGADGVSLTTTGDPAAAESGSAKWVLQGLFVSDPKTATPDLVALTTATFAPTITLPILSTPPTATLTSVLFEPTVTATAHVTATPDLVALTTATFEPTVSTPVLATPDAVALSLSTFEPDVEAGAGTTATPDVVNLTSSLFAPTVTATDHQTATPDLVALSLSSFAPTVTATDHQVVTPGVKVLNLSTFEPSIVVFDPNQTVTPSPASLTLQAFAPLVTGDAFVNGAKAKFRPPHNIRVRPEAARLRVQTHPISVEIFDQDLADFTTLSDMGLI